MNLRPTGTSARLGFLILALAPLHCSTPSTEVGRCRDFEPILATYAPPDGWDVATMSRIMYRESRCHPTSRSATHDSGLLQINDMHDAALTAEFGEPVTSFTLFDPVLNVRAAASLCHSMQLHHRSCYSPWGITDVVTPSPPPPPVSFAPSPPPPMAVPLRFTFGPLFVW